MRIVKRGTSAKEWAQQVTCRDCSSVLAIDAADLSRKQWYDQRDGSGEDYVEVRCPVCGAKVFVATTTRRSAFRSTEVHLTKENP